MSPLPVGDVKDKSPSIALSPSVDTKGNNLSPSVDTKDNDTKDND